MKVVVSLATGAVLFTFNTPTKPGSTTTPLINWSSSLTPPSSISTCTHQCPSTNPSSQSSARGGGQYPGSPLVDDRILCSSSMKLTQPVNSLYLRYTALAGIGLRCGNVIATDCASSLNPYAIKSKIPPTFVARVSSTIPPLLFNTSLSVICAPPVLAA